VVKGSPWTFNNHLLVIQTLKERDDPLEHHHEGRWSVAVFWLRELGSIWGVNVGESGGDKGMISRNIIFPNFLCDASINLGINLVGKVNLPHMVESDRLEKMDEGSLNEGKPMSVTEGKKGLDRIMSCQFLLPRIQTRLRGNGMTLDKMFKQLNLLSKSVEHYENSKLERPWTRESTIRSFGPQELARFGKLLEKLVRLKLDWIDNEDMAT
ncbi:hypothetical protein Goklo_014125, partial [Gossypium klotzschianum]|nr:hypothetical protein [Gossypium klotzschianum]